MTDIARLVESVGPNAIYILLMFGMWLAITAVYIPGTGFPEVLAVGSLLVTGIGLAFLPTNPVGLIILVVGFGCLLAIIFFRRYWAFLFAAGMIAQIIGSVFLFRAGSRPAIYVIGLVNLASIAYHQIILLPGLLIQDQAERLGTNALIGATGEVVAPINPVGTVRIEGELWTARSNEAIAPGVEVRVLACRGLELMVEPVHADRPHREAAV